MRSFATARDTVLFTVPRLIPSVAAISGSVMSSKYLSMTVVRIRCGSRSSARRTTSAVSLSRAWSATAWSGSSSVGNSSSRRWRRLLCASAVATLGLPPLRMPSSSAEAELWLAVLAFELALIAFLSPEVSEIMVRLGYSEPCELRRMPVGRTMSALHASSQWRRYAGQVSAGSPSDVWREGCWRFVVYPGYARGRPVNIVFAVYLQSRRPAVRAAVLDADTDEVLGPTGTRESAVL